MAIIPQVLINGFYHDVTSLDFRIDTLASYFQVKSINWSDGLEKGAVTGLGPQKIGRTRGAAYAPSFDFELYSALGDQFEGYLISKNAGGLYEVSFNAQVTFAAEGANAGWAVAIGGCVLTNKEQGGVSAGGTDALTKKYTCDVLTIVENNRLPFNSMIRAS